ncbi:MAG: HAD-IA family hydrolase [Kiloniellales bacterium]|nr:HAD-IA family hydrolase [Kiloniellales bacterium]MDJ0972036.1 HAD-IA family hydrolase [Kiloniellales bacterium]MDJ0982413.1 HAD-IA family hydrolase [Kiloniellales bacterium]
MLKAVSFDLWDTLVRKDSDEPKRAAQGLRSKLAERRRLVWQALNDLAPIAEDAVAAAYDGADAAFDRTRQEDFVTWTIGERLRRVLDSLGRDLPAETFAEIVKAHEEMEIAIPPDATEGIAEALGALTLRYRLCVVSDTLVSPAGTLRRLLASQGLGDFFTGFAFSDEVGQAKPHRAIFESAADQLGVEPQEMLHVGDSEDEDIEGAKALGMKAILFVGVGGSGRADTAADAVCERAADLPEIIEQLSSEATDEARAPAGQVAIPAQMRTAPETEALPEPVAPKPAVTRKSAEKAPRAWQRMLSGRRLDLLDPSPLDVEVEDIAHGLSRVARWNGQTGGDWAFTVAQHSLLVEEIFRRLRPAAGPLDCLAALLHDAPEYVVGDLITPFKSAIGSDYKALERRLLAAVYLRFGLPAELAKPVASAIKRADRAAAFLEATQLAGFDEAEARRIFGRPRGYENLGLDRVRLEPWPPSEAKSRFLARFAKLDVLETAGKED